MRLQQHGIAENPNRLVLKTKTDENGQFYFQNLPRETLVLFVDKRNYCWDNTYHKVNTADPQNNQVHLTF